MIFKVFLLLLQRECVTTWFKTFKAMYKLFWTFFVVWWNCHFSLFGIINILAGCPYFTIRFLSCLNQKKIKKLIIIWNLMIIKIIFFKLLCKLHPYQQTQRWFRTYLAHVPLYLINSYIILLVFNWFQKLLISWKIDCQNIVLVMG